MKNAGIYSEEWYEMVFEGKNQNYSAYQIRKNQVRRHIIAVLLSSTLFTMVIGSPIIINNVMKTLVKPKMDEKHILTDFDFKKPEHTLDIDLPKVENKISNSIRSVAPVISDEGDDEILSQDVLFNDKRVIGSVTVDYGSDDPDAKILNDKITGSEPVEVTTFVIVPQMHDFPGGEEELYKYLSRAVKYPREALEFNISGIVYTTFIINSLGEIKGIKILRGIGAGCDEEAIRVLREMPKWNPGKQNGRPVNVKLNLPIGFLLK